MDDTVEILKRIYGRFNARDIDGVLSVLAEDVAWANGMHGGHVHGQAAVRAYWTRQWAVVAPHVEPLGFREMAEGVVAVTVRQSIFDLEGKPVEDRSHGLASRTVDHVFTLKDGRVTRFDIADA